MEGVQPLGWSETPLRPPQPFEIPERSSDETEALSRLQALIEGRGQVDPFLTGEGIEGAQVQGRRWPERCRELKPFPS